MSNVTEDHDRSRYGCRSQAFYDYDYGCNYAPYYSCSPPSYY